MSRISNIQKKTPPDVSGGVKPFLIVAVGRVLR